MIVPNEGHDRFCEVQYAKRPFLGPIPCGCFDRSATLDDKEWLELMALIREKD